MQENKLLYMLPVILSNFILLILYTKPQITRIVLLMSFWSTTRHQDKVLYRCTLIVIKIYKHVAYETIHWISVLII